MAANRDRTRPVNHVVNNINAGYEKRQARLAKAIEDITPKTNIKPKPKKAPVKKDEGEPTGKMIQYRNLDDIPDGMPTSPAKYASASHAHVSHVPIQQPSMYAVADDDGEYYTESQQYSQREPPPLPAEMTKIPNQRFAPMMPAQNSPTHVSSHHQQIHHQQQQQYHPKPQPNYIPDEEDDWSDYDDDFSKPSPPKSHSTKHPPKQNYGAKAKPVTKVSPPKRAKQYEQLEEDALEEELAAMRADESSLYYSKEPRPVQYKPYTLSDYKRIHPKEYVEIAKLKPDLNTDELKAKRANAERIKEFSKNLQQYNRQSIVRSETPPDDKRQAVVLAKKAESKREKAREFAKQIPKPKITPMAERRRKMEEDAKQSRASEPTMEENEEERRLMELEAKHAQSRRQVDAIKRSLGM